MEKIVYDFNKVCKKCGRELPYSYRYFPYDKNCKYKLRNVCRECDKSYKNFLPEDYEPNERWSENDLKILKKYYKEYTNEELQMKFFPNRSIRGIECTAGKYGFNHKNANTLERALKNGASKNPMCQKGRIITDEAREHMSEAQKKRYQDPEQRRISREIALRDGRWQGDKHPIHLNPLYGEKNGRWKGGNSNSIDQFRRDIIDWKKQSSEFCNYKCVITGKRFQNIHHLTSFNHIIDTALHNVNIDLRPNISDYTKDEYLAIKNELLRLHESTPYGACLNSEIHTLFHKQYSYYDATIQNFLEFCNDIENGLYDDFFIEHKMKANINHEYIDYLNNKIA